MVHNIRNFVFIISLLALGCGTLTPYQRRVTINKIDTVQTQDEIIVCESRLTTDQLKCVGLVNFFDALRESERVSAEKQRACREGESCI